ncbi:MAG: hypothetical protein ACREMQ_19140 [Longimicrobiales bacterium]
MRSLLGGLFVCALLAQPSSVRAQGGPPGSPAGRGSLVPLTVPARAASPFGKTYRAPQLSPPSPGVAFLSSAILPGAGQYLLKEERWVPYVVLEAWALVTYLDRRQDGRALAQRYRDLAWSVARRHSIIGARRDTTFEYYEALAHHDASGLFDLDPRQTGVQPEQDSSTFNGGVWHLARSLYMPGGLNLPPGTPEYERALAHYMQNAIPPEFLWAWGPSLLEQQAYIGLIEESDDAFRTATQVLGVVVANHIVSAVDALVTARLQRAGAGALRIRLGGGLEPDVAGSRWSYWARLSW